jgi:hypothetical protein
MATNRADTLDPALLRPGRLDRKIEFPFPSRRERRLIFQTVTSKMNLGPDVDLEDCESSQKRNYVPMLNHYRRLPARPSQLSSNRFHLPSCWSARFVHQSRIGLTLTSP